MISNLTVWVYMAMLMKVMAFENICHCKIQDRCDTFTQTGCDSDCEETWYGQYCQKHNIAKGKTASQSSELHGYGCPCDATLALDGVATTTFDSKTCTHTDDTDSTGAHWTVYLTSGTSLNISYVQLYLRKDLGERIKGIEILVDDKLCSKSLQGHTGIQRLKCEQTLSGKSVTVRISGNQLTLCEVQVFVCSDGWFGEECDNQCHCFKTSEVCDKETGYCRSGCTAGKHGYGCQESCRNGWFGKDCADQCRCNDTSEICDKNKGYCRSGCTAGKVGSSCQQDCPDGNFGPNCSKRCQCLNPDEACNKTAGHCVSGCTAGKQGDDCQTDCTDGSFGPNCEQTCQCADHDEVCNMVTGHCMGGCTPGKQGDDCQTDCSNGSFGLSCSMLCQCATVDEACSKTTGHCESGCTPGKQGDDCQKDCATGIYGINCTQKCGSCMEPSNCNKVDGTCQDGCSSGFEGKNCSVRKQTQPSSSNPGMIAGIVVTVLVLLLVAVAGFVLWRKRARKSQERRCSKKDERSFNDISENKYPKERKKTGAEISDKTTSPVEKSTASSGNKKPEAKKNVRQDNEYENTDTYYNILPSPIPLPTLRQYIEDRLSGVGFDNEYKLLRSGLTAAHEEGRKPENKKKNRFIELFPYDHSRVVLSPDGDAKSDYINASYINGFHESSIFIAAQGPNTATVDDFWRMIWQENVTTVVMLTKLMEMTRKKCEQYWPNEKETKTCGNIISRASLSTVRADFTIRQFTVHHSKKPSDKRVMTQLHFTSWPDHDVPSAPALVGFWKQFRNLQEDNQENNRPVVVHCSAGVGRTGTFIGLDSLFDEAEQDNKVNVFTCVSKMREARMNMVQTASQYRFVHESLLEAIESKDTFYTSSEFEKKFGTDTAHTLVQESDISKQFQSLYSMRKEPKEGLVSDARLPENVNKNKSQEIVPANKSRPFLSTSVTGRNDYINAVVLPSATQLLGVIATQTPLKDTVVDFWRLVYDHDCFTIVCLDSERDLYPAKGHPIDCKRFRISLSQEDNTCNSFQKIQITLNIPENAESTRQITVYQLKTGITDNTPALFEFVNEVDRKTNTGERKLIVHCVDGSRLCGLFCCVLNIISRLKLDKEVDIYLTVRELQCIRPQFIDTYEQYKFCYNMVKEYHHSSSVYANM